MRNIFSKITITAGFLLAMAFTFSCSVDYNGGNDPSSSSSPGGVEQSYNYCITAAGCLAGPFTASTCNGQLSNTCPNGSSPSGGGSSSSVGVTQNTYSLNGIWKTSSGHVQITVSGSIGVYSFLGASSSYGQSAIDKGYIKVGDQVFRNLTSTGNLTWSGQVLQINYNKSTNEATGTSWVNGTFALSADGQTLSVTGTFIDGTTTTTYTRGSSQTIDGIWKNSSGNVQITVSGSIGVYSFLGASSSYGQSAIDKGYIKVGDQVFRNLTSTGNLTWSGQVLQINYNKSTNEATGTSLVNGTFTLSTDGQTLSVTGTFIDGTTTTTYTRVL